jgi:dTDP-glucose 4,6-dehydratase
MAPPLPNADLELILDHTHELWDEMRGQRIFLTGGTGFFGCWLVESFLFVNRVLDLDASIVVLTRDPAAFARKCPHLSANPALTLVSGDVREFCLPEHLDGCKFRYVIHAATDTTSNKPDEPGASQPLHVWHTIVQGTEHTLRFAASHGTRKFLLTSSGAVYGEQPAHISHLPESYAGAPDPLKAGSSYAEGKRAAELLCSLYASEKLECKIARCFAFVGPHLPLDAHFAVGNFVRDAMRGDVIRIHGDGTPKRSYLYAADLAIWLWTILFRGPSGEAFNVGSEEALSIVELAEAVRAAIGSRAPVQTAEQAIAGKPGKQYVPSTSKAAQQLGLKCYVSLNEALRRTQAWQLS